MPRVQFEKIVKSYGRVTVLKNLDLEIEDGEFVVLLGPSGCGKTTLLNLLAGLLEVTLGRIQIGDRDVTELDPKDRGLAMVFQSYALYPTKTVRGNLKFGLVRAASSTAPSRSGASPGRRKLLQIEPLLDRKPSQLSGGQRQRVAIGRALVKQVGVFLFDEPLSNLDAKLRTETRIEIKRLHDETKSDRRLCHARPDRGDDDGDPHRRHERGRHPAVRYARRGLRASGQPLRRRLHRRAGDEHLPRQRFPSPPASCRRPSVASTPSLISASYPFATLPA